LVSFTEITTKIILLSLISEKGSQLGAHLLILGEALQKLEEDYF
jgi:hypothetical protein